MSLFSNLVRGAITLVKQATSWHFEDRHAKNINLPSYDEVSAQNSGWREASPQETRYHDNGYGEPELKYVHPDGREAVYDGDTHQLITDADPMGQKIMGTYNYVTPNAMPKELPVNLPDKLLSLSGWKAFAEQSVENIDEWIEFAVAIPTDIDGWRDYAVQGLGHLALDLIPYWIGGNVREAETPQGEVIEALVVDLVGIAGVEPEFLF